MSRPWERSVARADRCKKRFLKQSEGRGEGKMSRKQARYRMGPRDSSREQVKRGIKLAWSSSPGPPQGVQSRWHVYHARSRVSCHALHANRFSVLRSRARASYGFTLLATQCRATCLYVFSFPSRVPGQVLADSCLPRMLRFLEACGSRARS